MKNFEQLQAQLGRAWALNRPGMGVEHVLVVLPSFSVGESLLSHYASRIPALEHRYLVTHLMLHRIQACELVFLTCQAPSQEVVDYYTSLVPTDRRASVRARFRLLVVPDNTPRAIAAKLLDRPDLLQALRASFGDRPVFIGPWNVTDREVEVALRLQVPIDGTVPSLWPLGYKSAGRRLFAEAGVPAPVGREEVRTVEEVVAAIAAIRAARPAAPGVVIKHDNSGAGDGNVVIDLRQVGGGPAAGEQVRARVAALPEWFWPGCPAGRELRFRRPGRMQRGGLAQHHGEPLAAGRAGCLHHGLLRLRLFPQPARHLRRLLAGEPRLPRPPRRVGALRRRQRCRVVTRPRQFVASPEQQPGETVQVARSQPGRLGPRDSAAAVPNARRYHVLGQAGVPAEAGETPSQGRPRLVRQPGRGAVRSRAARAVHISAA
jgi:hypothetical protein